MVSPLAPQPWQPVMHHIVHHILQHESVANADEHTDSSTCESKQTDNSDGGLLRCTASETRISPSWGIMMTTWKHIYLSHAVRKLSVLEGIMLCSSLATQHDGLSTAANAYAAGFRTSAQTLCARQNPTGSRQQLRTSICHALLQHVDRKQHAQCLQTGKKNVTHKKHVTGVSVIPHSKHISVV
jgi:hypothetical protein